MRTLLATLSILCTSNAMAADWQEYFHSQADSRHYIDRNSIIRLEKNKIRAWEKMVSSSGNGNRHLTEVDCKQRMYTIRAMEPLDANDIEGMKVFNDIVRGWTEPEQAWEYIDTTDSQEALYNTWCGKKMKKGKK
jgi:hypothetical protein